MTKRFYLFLALCASLFALSGCGGGDSDNARVRIVNASLDHASIDVFFDDERKHTAVGSGTVSTYLDYKKDTATLKVTRAGNSASVLETSFTTAGDVPYTIVIYGSEGNLGLSAYSENEAEASNDKTKVRVMNASTDAGSVDFFASTSATSVSDLLARSSGLGSATPSAWVELDKGTYRMWFTANGDKEDLRLATQPIPLDNKKLNTVVLLPTTGGALLNALVLEQEKAAVTALTTSARLRLVAGLDQGERVAVTVGDNRALSNSSPSISSYVTIASGQQSIAITANGQPLTTIAADLAAGSDNTLITYGSASSASAKIVSDSNRLPTQSSRLKMRLVNGFASTNGALTLSADYLPVASGVALGTASAYSTVTSGVYSRIDVAEGNTPIYVATDITLQTGGVYSVFQLGTRANPVGVIRRDR